MTPQVRHRLREIFTQTADEYGLNEADIYIRDRSRALTTARSEAWRRAYDAGFSTPQIASIGGWDHTSILHGISQARSRDHG